MTRCGRVGVTRCGCVGVSGCVYTYVCVGDGVWMCGWMYVGEC